LSRKISFRAVKIRFEPPKSFSSRKNHFRDEKFPFRPEIFFQTTFKRNFSFTKQKFSAKIRSNEVFTQSERFSTVF